MLKKEIRVLGIDDAPFDKFRDKKVLVVGTIFRGGNYLDGILSTHITPDGTDSTKNLIKIINSSKHKGQLQFIILDGIALGGFNVIDIQKLSEKTKFPVIIVIRNYPNLLKIKKALMRLKNGKGKIKLLEKAGKIFPVEIKNKKIYIQISGLSLDKAKEIVKLTSTRSLLPEPIRAAHLIASGIVLGESRGRA